MSLLYPRGLCPYQYIKPVAHVPRNVAAVLRGGTGKQDGLCQQVPGTAFRSTAEDEGVTAWAGMGASTASGTPLSGGLGRFPEVTHPVLQTYSLTYPCFNFQS
jgi:hypothetical protein